MSEPTRWRKKPVVIEAMLFERQFPVRYGNRIAEWCGGRFTSDAKPSDHSDVAYRILIPTLEGVMEASPGDWIIKGVHGEFYPIKPHIFEATYERADDE